MIAPDFADRVTNRIPVLTPNVQLLLLMGLAAVVIFSGIGLRSPWPADEPRFAEAAREMIDSGQWLIPMRGGEFYPDKPPVFMWVIAFFYWLTGDLKVAFLLPNALCGLLTLGLVADLGRRFADQRTAVVVGFLLLLAPQFLIQAKNAQIDAMVACWITVACYGLLRHFFERPAWSWYFTAWGFMGLGIITKGVGFLPLLMFVPILILALQDKEFFRDSLKWRCLLGPLVMLAVAAAWVLPMVVFVEKLGTEAAYAYRDNILFKQTGERYVDSWGHIKPWHYFISNAVPLLWFPLPLILLSVWRHAVDAFRNHRVVFTLLVWVVLAVTFFSISPGKRGVYILPALPMFALAMAMILRKRAIPSWLGQVLTGLHGLLGIMLVALGLLAWNDHPVLVDKISDYSRNPEHLHQAGTFALSLGLVWLGTLALLLRTGSLYRWFSALMVSWLLFSTWGYTLAEPFRTPENVMRKTAELLPDGAQLGLVDFAEQFILFSPLDITHFSYLSSTQEQERNAWQWIGEGADRYLLVDSDVNLTCFDKVGAIDVGVAHRRAWVVLSANNRLEYCTPPAKSKRFFTPNPSQWLD
jgi:4-amino-4-deoxy-L-arabinose transferase-like glycosyltransferase